MIIQKGSLTKSEADAIFDYQLYNRESDILIDLVQREQKEIKHVYRGVKYRKELLKVGMEYRHWNELLAWSSDKEYARWFATNGCYSEELVESIAKSRGFDELNEDIEKQIKQEFINVLFILEYTRGFAINDYIINESFCNENEVIVFNDTWVIQSITESVDSKGNTCFEALLQKK